MSCPDTSFGAQMFMLGALALVFVVLADLMVRYLNEDKRGIIPYELFFKKSPSRWKEDDELLLALIAMAAARKQQERQQRRQRQGHPEPKTVEGERIS